LFSQRRAVSSDGWLITAIRTWVALLREDGFYQADSTTIGTGGCVGGVSQLDHPGGV